MNSKHESLLLIELPLQHQFFMLFMFVLKKSQLMGDESGKMIQGIDTSGGKHLASSLEKGRFERGPL